MFDANDEKEGKFLHKENGVVVTGCQSRSKQQSVNQSISNQTVTGCRSRSKQQSINQQSAIIQSHIVRVGQNSNQ